MLVDVSEEEIAISVFSNPVSTVIDSEAFNVSISEESYLVNLDPDTLNVSIQEEVFAVQFDSVITINNSFDIDVLNKSERKDVQYDTPSTGDITIYYGIAAPQSLETDPVWLISKTIYTAPDMDSVKLFASVNYDQKWSDRLTISTYK